jgi:RNA polymerase sigma factor (sigma-70 family)
VGFNNGRERRKFEELWKKLREQYISAGFSDEGIAAMRAFDEDAYRSRRRFEEHNQPLPSEDFADDGPRNRRTLFDKFEGFAVSFDEDSFVGRHSWVDAVGDPDLSSKLKRLSDDDLELLTLYVIEGYSQPEIARLLGCTKQNISKRIRGIVKKIK